MKTTVRSVKLTAELSSRFFAKVEVTDDCWLWRGRVNPGGAGQMRIASKSSGPQGGTRVDVHRLSHLWWKGPIPDGHEIDHTCRVSICVNPAHLEAVLPEENRKRAEQWRKRDALRAAVLRRSRELRAATRDRKKVTP